MYWHGHWQDLCRGPHLPAYRPGPRRRLQADEGRRRLLARRQQSRTMLQRIYGVAFQNRDELKKHLTFLEEAEKRDHRKLGREMELFHMQEEAPGQMFWHPNGWTIYTSCRTTCAASSARAATVEVNTPAGRRPQAVGGLGPLGQVSGEHVHRRSRRGTRARKGDQRAQADELPLPRADLQPGHQVLSRPAAAHGRVRLLQPL